MNVIWLFPPMGEGFPNVSQYRFYKKMPIRASIIYPYLAASGVTLIHEAGHDVELLDCPTKCLSWEDITPKLQAADLVILEGRTPILDQIHNAIKVIKGLAPGVPVAVYGDHVSWDPMSTLMEGADFIIQGGDYDVSAAHLAGALAQDDSVLRRIWNYKQVNLDDLPFVDRELVDWRDYYEAWKKRDVFLWNMSSRGCPYHCIFCAWAGTFWDHEWRGRSPQNYFNEMNDLFLKYGEMELLDDADLFSMRFGKEFSRILADNCFKKEILWSCQTHPAQILSVSVSDLRFMKKHGLSVVKLGIESSHDSTLQWLKKGSSRSMIEKAIRNLQEADVMVHANMMIGFPPETKKMALESLEWIKKLDPNQAQFSMVIPYPNTEIWKKAEENDWFIQDKLKWSLYDASFPMLKMEGLSGEEIVDLYVQLWRSFYFNPRFIWRHLKTIRHWEGVKSLFKGARSVAFGHMKAVDRKRREQK